MKKLCFLIIMALLGMQAHAALIITNNSNCTIQVRVMAHDANHTGSCALRSNVITLIPGDFAMFSNVSSLNTAPGPGWDGGAMAATTGGATVWGWDAVECYGLSNMLVGHPGTCATYSVGSIVGFCGVADVGGEFYVTGSNTVADFF